VKRSLSVLNQYLATRTFLVGERISLADIAVCCNLLQLYSTVLEPAFRQPYQNVNRWFLTIVNQPQVKSVVGDFKLCEKMAQFDSKKYQELHGGDKKQDKKEKKQPQQKQEPKKAAPKKPEPEPEEDDVPKEKPSKDPFAVLPKGTFVMDDWKKMYSNNDFMKVALPWFFENFDSENYSVWYCEYKYNDELTLTFMSSNLIGGMFQRLDRMRKHAFGNVLLFGESNNSTISGVWIWRGHDLAFTLSPDLQVDYGSYEWKKLEWNTDETKKLITEYWNHEGEFGGKKFHSGKTFK